MKFLPLILAVSFLALPAPATVRYVDVNSTNATPPFTNWASAAVTIQDAIDVADPDDEILVTNGVYQIGGRAVYGLMTNRVAVHKPLMLRSVNGPELTEIRGYQLPNAITGDGAIRCVYLTNGASLTGFKLTKGATRRTGEEYRERHGGGVWCEPSAVVSNCVIIGNSAHSYGGGAHNGTLYNCALSGNSADAGGGASGVGLRVNLNSCTVVGNSARSRGGVLQGRMNNCIVYFNNALDRLPNHSGAGDIINYSCTTPLPSSGAGNIDLDPRLADGSHLRADSPCRGSGNVIYASGVDIDGELWASPPSMGCDEYSTGAALGTLRVSLAVNYTNIAAGFTVEFIAQIEGITTSSVWDFGDGVLVTNGPYSGRLFGSHAWASSGDYAPVLRAYNHNYPGGVSATQTVHVAAPPVHYVAPNNATPSWPYDSWATAANTIQDAIDAASTVPGTWVLVTNGTYSSGGRAVYGMMTNRVVVHKPLTVRSVNGPQVTLIQGHQVGGAANGDGAIRCVYLTNGASLFGFTLANGATRSLYDVSQREASGGAVWCESREAVVSNCVLVANTARQQGGGQYQGTLYNCIIASNRVTDVYNAFGGGVAHSTLIDCTLTVNSSAHDGGGAHVSTLTNCTLNGNSADENGGGALGAGGTLVNCAIISNTAYFGGGTAFGTLINCMLVGNSAQEGGGAAFSSSVSLESLNNCTLIFNSAVYGGGARYCTMNNCTLMGNLAVLSGGGADSGGLNNCIVYYNTAPSGSNYSNTALNYCCATPLPVGPGNFTNAPLFVDVAGGNLRLQTDSPCINAGTNAYASGSTDLDGRPRIVGGTVDIGAYEFQGVGMGEFFGWLQQYGLRTDGSADFADTDGEGMNNWQEWRAGTVPTNALSALQMLSPTGNVSGVTVRWRSVSTRNYWVERGTNLAVQPAFSTIVTNLPGQVGMSSYTDTNVIGNGLFFYRVGVQP